jgi:hypothetical protein
MARHIVWFPAWAVLIAGIFGSSINMSFWGNYERMGGICDLTHWLVLASVLIFVIRGLRKWKIVITIYLGISWITMLIAAGESFGIRTFDWISIGRAEGRVSGPAGNPSFLAGEMMVNGLLALALFTDIARSVHVNRAAHTIGLALFFVLTSVK